MAKFGEIINANVPVLICFYSQQNNTETNLNDVFSILKDKVKVIKIDILKNRPLVEALRIDNLTFVIYKNSEMQWREEGDQKAIELLKLLQGYI